MNKETAEALTELAKAAAKQQGWNESEPLLIRVSNQTEPNVCDKHCGICEGQTHHWLNLVYGEDDPHWKCKHCDHKVSYRNRDDHPSGCDCPDCLPDDGDYDDSESWLCSCGNFIEDGCHCSNCGGEPPWGCPCSFCQDGDEDDDDLSYSDVMREDWNL